MSSHFDHKPTWNSLGLNLSFVDKMWTTSFLLYGAAYIGSLYVNTLQ
jgi:hypothetical protein